MSDQEEDKKPYPLPSQISHIDLKVVRATGTSRLNVKSAGAAIVIRGVRKPP